MTVLLRLSLTVTVMYYGLINVFQILDKFRFTWLWI